MSKMNTHTILMRIFLVNRELASFPFDSHSPVILILSVFTGLAEILHKHRVLQAAPRD